MQQTQIGYLYASISTHNPSVPSINEAILNSKSIQVRGLDISHASLAEALRLIRDTDVLLVESSSLLGRTNATGEPKYRKFNRGMDADLASTILELIWQSASTLVLLEGNYDIHAPLGFGLTHEEMERIDYLIWPYTAEPVSYGSGSRPARYVEPWIHDKLEPAENWRLINKAIPRQIEYHHSLNANDFSSPTSLRLWDAIVPGAPYKTREIASTSALAEGFSLAPYQALDKALRVGTSSISALGISAGDSIRFTLRRMNMRQMMRHSRSVYVCGGGQEYFVRKFLEVPALGLPMFAFPVEPLERLGFHEGEHYVRTLPEDFGKTLKYQLERPGSHVNDMANRAQNLVKSLHTSSIRAKNILELVSGTRDGAFDKAIFVNGSIVPMD